MCQSTILVRWHAQWYFWISGRPNPLFSLGSTSLSQLSLEVLEVQMRFLHILFNDEERKGRFDGDGLKKVKKSGQDIHSSKPREGACMPFMKVSLDGLENG